MKQETALFIHNISLKVGAAVVICWAAGSGLFEASASTNLRPEWSRARELRKTPNASFLNDLHHSNVVDPLDDLLDQRAKHELKQKFQDMSRDYELKRTYGLVDPIREQQREDEVRSFGREIFGEVRRYQTLKQTNKLRAAADREPGLKPLAKPAAVVGAGAAVYTGTPVNLKLNDETRVRAMTNVPKQKGEFTLSSPVVNTAVLMDLSRPETKDPNAPPELDPTLKPEKYRVSVSRGLPIWGLSSGVSYGLSTSNMRASLSKGLTEHLTAVVDTVRPMRSGKATTEESLKLFYGIEF